MSTNIKNILSGRAARNIYFWVIVAAFIYVLNPDGNEYPRSVYNNYKSVTTVLLIIMAYINNLVLMPRLMAKKKHWQYYLAAFGLCLITALAFIIVMKDMMVKYPLISVHEVSLITFPINDEWTAKAIAEDTLGMAFGLGLWLVIFSMAWFMVDHTKQQRLAQEATNRQLETELSLLRNQVNPHFFFNTLNNIYGLTLQHSDKAPESILKLSSIMRYLLYETNTRKAPFDKEREAMQAYIDMELLRLPQNEDFRFHIEADDNYEIPPLLWLPVLENVFKHGTRVIADNYFINYSFTITKAVIKIIAENNYKENGSDKPGGLGLTNLRKRLQLLYPDKHSIDIDKTPGKYRIEVTVTLY